VGFVTPGDEIVEALAERRWWSRRDAIPAPLIARLSAVLVAHETGDGLSAAAIGRRDRRHLDASIRGDRIRWLGAAQPVERALLDELERLRADLNRRAYFGLERVEAHFASYPVGAFYRRHIDTFRDSDARVLSFVLYLNDGWQPSDGGELVLYSREGDAELARIMPSGGTLVVFDSAHVPHEVLPTLRTRRSIAGWFRRRA
jgi:SM-20-related protein